MSLETVLAELVATTGEIPPAARTPAIEHLTDGIGVSLAAAPEPPGRVIEAVVAQGAGRAQARVLGTTVATSVADAAWANGSLAHLLDFDDTGFSHPTACIMPAALAVGELVGATGHEVIDAMVLGYEVFERLAACARPSEPILRQRGLHPTSIWGSPAAAAAAARLLHLDTDQIRVALGIAASNASGLTQQFGTWSKGLNAGNAARAGVSAALLAQAGYEADRDGISGPYGLFHAMVGAGNYDLSGVSADLGTRWSIADPGISIKPYPACTSTLRAVDAMVLIAAADGYDPGRVREIQVHVHPDLLHTLRYRAPTHGFNGKFSLDYTVAAAALDGTLTLGSFTDAAAGRPAMRAMLDRVRLEEHPEWEMSRRHDNPIVVTMDDGQVYERSVPKHKGTLAWPLTTDEFASKFVDCASRTLDEGRAQQALSALLGIDHSPDVRMVVDLLVPSTAGIPA